MIWFAWPWVLLALPLPLIARALLPAARPPHGVALRLPSLAGLGPLVAATRTGRWRAGVAALIWLLLVLAAARPQTAGAPVPLPMVGRDLLLAIDISGSMGRAHFGAGEPAVTRLDLVRDAATALVARREADRLGLILFADRAHLLTPLTYDHTAVTQALAEAMVGLAGSETALGDAIGLAVKRLRDAPPGERLLLLFTDGANNAGALSPLAAAELAAAAGVRIHAIGLAAPPGIDPGVDPGIHPGVKATVNAGAPLAELDPDTLRAVAARTGGRFFRATDAADLAQVSRLIEALEPSVRGQRTWRPAVERYPWPAGAALVLGLVLGWLLALGFAPRLASWSVGGAPGWRSARAAATPRGAPAGGAAEVVGVRAVASVALNGAPGGRGDAG